MTLTDPNTWHDGESMEERRCFFRQVPLAIHRSSLYRWAVTMMAVERARFQRDLRKSELITPLALQARPSFFFKALSYAGNGWRRFASFSTNAIAHLYVVARWQITSLGPVKLRAHGNEENFCLITFFPGRRATLLPNRFNFHRSNRQ